MTTAITNGSSHSNPVKFFTNIHNKISSTISHNNSVVNVSNLAKIISFTHSHKKRNIRQKVIELKGSDSILTNLYKKEEVDELYEFCELATKNGFTPFLKKEYSLKKRGQILIKLQEIQSNFKHLKTIIGTDKKVILHNKIVDLANSNNLEMIEEKISFLNTYDSIFLKEKFPISASRIVALLEKNVSEHCIKGLVSLSDDLQMNEPMTLFLNTLAQLNKKLTENKLTTRY